MTILPVRRPVLALLAVEKVVLLMILTVGLDLYAHARVEELGGPNIWGYRGQVAHQKQSSEIRIALVGGTRAFSFGREAAGTTAGVIRQNVMLTTDRRGGALHPVVAVNLARFGALPDSYASTIERYAYLRPDYVCIYDDLGVGGAPGPEDTSGIFSLTGYMPALPLALTEKGMLWRFGDISTGYGARTPMNRASPSWPRRIAGMVLQRIGTTAAAVDRRFARMRAPRNRSAWAGASDPSTYAETLAAAIDVAQSHARGVVVVVSPAETAKQSANLAAIESRLSTEFASDRRLRFVSLEDVPELHQEAFRLDGWNYGGDATAAAAAKIAPAVLELIAQ